MSAINLTYNGKSTVKVIQTPEAIQVGGTTLTAVKISTGPTGPQGPQGPKGDQGIPGTGGSVSISVRPVSGNSNIVITDDIINADATNGNIILSLPLPNTVVKVFTVKKVDSSSHTISVLCSSANIENAASAVIKSQGEAIDIFSDLTNYFIK